MSFYDAFTHGMTALPHAPQPLWAFEARCAGNRAWSAAAQQGLDGEVCQTAWQRAYDQVREASV